MADKKISALTGATTPLDGTEVLPIVQSGATVKVANNDLRPKQIQSNATSGVLQVTGPASASTRVATVPDANFTVARTDAAQSFTGDQTLSTGNIIQGTAAKGFNFTANTGAAGKTSQLLNWYETGTWTPIDISGASLVFTNASGYYTRTGDVVTAFGRVTFPITVSGLTANIGGLPFTVINNNQPGGGYIRITDSGRNDTVVASGSSTGIVFYSTSLVAATNANYSTKRVDWVVIYKT